MAFPRICEVNPYSNKPYSIRYYNILKKQQTLPVWQHRDQLVQLLACHQMIIFQG